MSRRAFRWRLSLLCMFIVWSLAFFSMIISSSLPEGWRMLLVILPAGTVLFIGILAANHWWTRSAALLAWPFLAVGVVSLVDTLGSIDGTQYDSSSAHNTMASLGFGIVFAIVTVALASLGVDIGQRLYGTNRDDIDLVRDAVDLLERAWPFPFSLWDILDESPPTYGWDSPQAADAYLGGRELRCIARAGQRDVAEEMGSHQKCWICLAGASTRTEAETANLRCRIRQTPVIQGSGNGSRSRPSSLASQH